MNLLRIVSKLLGHSINSVKTADDRSFDHILNEKLHEMAAFNGIELNRSSNLVAEAVMVATQALGGGFYTTRDEAHMVAMEAIDRVVSRQAGEGGFKELNKDYARNTVLVHIILDLKSKGSTLEEVRIDPRVQEICSHFKIQPGTVAKYYKGDVKPNQGIADIAMAGLRNTKQRSNVFEEFKHDSGATFETFWFTAVKNECHNISKEWRAEKYEAVQDALRLVPENRAYKSTAIHELHLAPVKDQVTGVELGEINEEKVPEEEKPDLLELNQLAKKLKSDLKSINPDYLAALELMNNNHLDITNKRHYHYFKDALKIPDDISFLRFQKSFLMDLKSVFSKLEVNNSQEASQVMRLAKAKKIATITEAVYGKFLLRVVR